MEFRFDSMKYAYPSKRRVVFGKKGMVATSQPLAAQAGLDMMKQGGNAIDAAIATAICLTVLEPNNCGIGGDAFALVWVKNQLYGLNGSGPAPMGIDVDEIRRKYGSEMPKHGWTPVTVPGIPSAWAELSKRFGKLPFEQLFQPAIGYAREGFPVAPSTALLWRRCYDNYKEAFKEPHLQHWFENFAPKGRGPEAGEIMSYKDTAKTLELLAKTNCEAFYRGEIGDKIDAFSRETGGYLRKEDLTGYRAEWVAPISVDYKGYQVWEIPPNGHGIVALMALKLLSKETFTARDCPETYHKQIEAMKLAFIDGQHYVTDPKSMKVTAEELLSDEYAQKRRNLIGRQALTPQAGDPRSGDTVYLCTADEEGNMVSFIQSNYMDFGSGIVVPNTGIALHNRGNNFYLDKDSENCIAPGKKPYHTIIPGFLTKDGRAVGPFGVMGGFMQPQGHVQMIMNLVDFGMNPQESLDAPRWQWKGGKSIELEQNFNPYHIEQLVNRGHEITLPADSYFFGRGQIIWRNDEGTLCGGTEPRSDGTVAAW